MGVFDNLLMQPISKVVKSFLDSQDIKASYVKGEHAGRFEFLCQVKNCSINVQIDVEEQQEFFVVKGVPDFVVPQEKIMQVLPVLNQCNRKNMFVKAQVDSQTGYLTFSMPCLAFEGSIKEKMVASAVITVANTIDSCINEIKQEVNN